MKPLQDNGRACGTSQHRHPIPLWTQRSNAFRTFVVSPSCVWFKISQNGDLAVHNLVVPSSDCTRLILDRTRVDFVSNRLSTHTGAIVVVQIRVFLCMCGFTLFCGARSGHDHGSVIYDK